MSIRSCATCGAPLRLADEVCALGHLVLEVPPEQTVEGPPGDRSELAELRAKVNEAFVVAESQLQLLTAKVEAPAAPSAPPPPPPPPPPQLFTPLPGAEADRVDDPITAFAPAARLDWGPEKNGSSRAAGLLKRFNR